ncbi:unnamed protein product [Urochloa humidicola]
MDGDDSYGHAYSLMSTEEPHAEPELPPSPRTEATTFAAEFLDNIARFAASLPAGPYVAHDVTFDMNLLDSWRDEEDQVNGDDDVVDARVGADDDAYAYGGFGAVPASGDAMASLPEKTVGEGEATEEECAVCLEAYEAGDALRTMPCAHAFHQHCIFGWLAVSRLCPLCRFALPAEVDSDADEEDDDDDDDDGDDTEDEEDDDADVSHESLQFLFNF